MNLDYWIRRLSGRATCELGKGAKLFSVARIRNISGVSQQIRIGNCTHILGELLVFAHGGEIVIGDWCYLGEGSRIWSAGSIHIGDRVLVSHGVNVLDSLTHPISARQRHAHFKAIVDSGHPVSIDLGERPVVIGNDVWIGANACVLRGVNIGEGAIIGASAVVTHDIPPYTVVAGNPARIIRELSADER